MSLADMVERRDQVGRDLIPLLTACRPLQASEQRKLDRLREVAAELDVMILAGEDETATYWAEMRAFHEQRRDPAPPTI